MESPRKRITIDEANEISCSYTNETVLHTACRKDDSVQVQRLIDTGADIEAANTEGMTPLHEASRRGVTRVRQVVVGRGCQHGGTKRKRNDPFTWHAKLESLAT
jgi:hypothetical protein